MVHETENSKQSAFPVAAQEGSYVADGLTKREYFAGLAMQGVLAYSNAQEPPTSVTEWNFDLLAQAAVKAADALLNELSK